MGRSGRKERIVISCVTFEVAKVVDPVKYYEATKVHLLHYVKEGAESKDNVYAEFFEEVIRQIREYSGRTEIREHNCVVFNFSEVMRTVLSIIQSENAKCNGNLDVYVNISAGTSEYSAAALIASMMNRDIALPFTVSTEEYQVPADKIRSVYYDENGTPVGLTKTTRDPAVVSAYPIESPPDDKVLALSILKTQIDKKDACAATMMPLLRDGGIIEPYEERDNSKPQQKAVMKYQRNFVDYWINNRWVEKVSKRKAEITELGEDVLNVFYDSYAVRNGKIDPDSKIVSGTLHTD